MLVTVAREEAFGNTKTRETGENGENGKNRDKDPRTNLLCLMYLISHYLPKVICVGSS